MSKTKLFHQNFLLIFQKSLTINIFLDPKEGVNPPPLPPYAHVCYYIIFLATEKRADRSQKHHPVEGSQIAHHSLIVRQFWRGHCQKGTEHMNE